MEGEIKTPPFSREARIEAGMLLRRLQQGESLGLPHSRPMPDIGPRCHELRIRDKGKNWRIFYHLSADAVVILDVHNKDDAEDATNSPGDLQPAPKTLPIHSMKPEKKQQLEAAGFKVGSADEFLGLSPEESALVSLRLALAGQVRSRRLRLHYSQAELARRVGSSQSRIAKLEAAESDVSLDFLFRALFATGANMQDVSKVFAAA